MILDDDDTWIEMIRGQAKTGFNLDGGGARGGGTPPLFWRGEPTEVH